jgi:hypothetical protein
MCIHINDFSVLYNSEICYCHLWLHWMSTVCSVAAGAVICCYLTVGSWYMWHFKFWVVINAVHDRLFLLIKHGLYFSKLLWCCLSCCYFIHVVPNSLSHACPVFNNIRWAPHLIDALTLLLLLQTDCVCSLNLVFTFWLLLLCFVCCWWQFVLRSSYAMLLLTFLS